MDDAAGGLAELGFGRGEDFLTPSADIDRGSEFKEALGRGLAQARAAAGDQDAFVLQQILLVHGSPKIWASDCIGEGSPFGWDWPTIMVRGRANSSAVTRSRVARTSARHTYVSGSHHRRRESRSRHTGNVEGCWNGQRSA